MTTTTIAQTSQVEKDQTEIIAFLEQMGGYFEAKNVNGIMACYTPEPLVVMQPETPVTNLEELRSMFANLVMAGPQIVFGKHEVFVNGDKAMHISDWKMSGTAPDGTPISDSGVSVVMLERQPKGGWLIVFDNPYANFVAKK